MRAFDVSDGAIGHGFLPDYSNSKREIRTDESEQWSYYLDKNETSNQ